MCTHVDAAEAATQKAHCMLEALETTVEQQQEEKEGCAQARKESEEL